MERYVLDRSVQARQASNGWVRLGELRKREAGLDRRGTFWTGPYRNGRLGRAWKREALQGLAGKDRRGSDRFGVARQARRDRAGAAW